MLLLALAACSDREPALSVDLATGEVLIVGAVAGDRDVALEVVSPSGEVVTARTSRAEHRAANVRVTGAGGWEVRAGSSTVIRREPMSGDVCTQLDALLAESWDLPGVEQPGADDTRRTRSLVAVMPWADECTVNRLGGMDGRSNRLRAAGPGPRALANDCEGGVVVRGLDPRPRGPVPRGPLHRQCAPPRRVVDGGVEPWFRPLRVAPIPAATGWRPRSWRSASRRVAAARGHRTRPR